MASNVEQEHQRQGQAQAQTQTATVEKPRAKEDSGGKLHYCKYCGELLGGNQKFCPKCGEKYGGQEHTCPICGAVTTKPSCPKCKGSYTCSKCGITGTSPVCSCGAILDKALAAQAAAPVVEEQTAPPKQMTQEEVKRLEALFRAEDENPGLKKIQKSLREREKLLMQREYYNKMQKEIVEVFGARPFSVEVPDAEEQAALLKIYASLERTIIDKRRHATQAELEALYPELRYIHDAENRAADEKAKAEEEEQARRLELEKRRREMEARYRATLAGIEQEIQEAKDTAHNADEAQKAAERQRLLVQKAEEEALIERERVANEEAARKAAERRARIAAEEKARAEEQARAEAAKAAADAAERQRAMREAQERAARQAYTNRILGTYYYQEGFRQLTIIIENENKASCRDIFEVNGPMILSGHAMSMTGSQVHLRETSNPANYFMSSSFQGELNQDGTILTGCWIRENGERNRLLTYHKVR